MFSARASYLRHFFSNIPSTWIYTICEELAAVRMSLHDVYMKICIVVTLSSVDVNYEPASWNWTSYRIILPKTGCFLESKGKLAITSGCCWVRLVILQGTNINCLSTLAALGTESLPSNQPCLPSCLPSSSSSLPLLPMLAQQTPPTWCAPAAATTLRRDAANWGWHSPATSSDSRHRDS